MTITDNEILAKIKLPEEKEEGFRVLMSTYKRHMIESLDGSACKLNAYP